MTDYHDAVACAAQHLRAAENQLQQELKSYPTPIAGCDEQYTHLLAERRRVRDALRALRQSIFVPTPRRLFETERMESR